MVSKKKKPSVCKLHKHLFYIYIMRWLYIICLRSLDQSFSKFTFMCLIKDSYVYKIITWFLKRKKSSLCKL